MLTSSALRSTAALLLAASVVLSCGPQGPGSATLDAGDPAAGGISQLTLTPAALTLWVGETQQLTAAASDADGAAVPATLSWASDAPSVAQVSDTGEVTALGTGAARITVSIGSLTAHSDLTVSPAADPNERVVYADDNVAFILGPQLQSGAAANPWPWFDTNATVRGHVHGTEFPADPTNNDDFLLQHYYDLTQVEYLNYYRTGDPAFRTYARKAADSLWRSQWIGEGTVTDFDNSLAPRDAGLGGLMLRALDGRPELWPWMTAYVRYAFDVWVGARTANTELHYGVRDGGYMLLYAAYLAKVHPDPDVRAEFLQKALVGARDYYARLQQPDGSWRWREIPGSAEVPFMQPFMVGLLLDGMIAVHRLTADPVVAAAIIKSVENLYEVAYRQDTFNAYGGGQWRGMWYFVYGASCAPAVAGPCGEGEPMAYEDIIREVRQLNPLVIHAFGYAYKLTSDVKFRTWGDELFAATYGKGSGPGADAWYGLADYRAKEYNQSYRTAGRYLVWRAGL